MENVRKLLDACKNKTAITSHYALELPNQRIYDYYEGRRASDEFACLRISEVLGKPLDEVITAVKLDTEKNEKRRSAWERHYKSIGGIAVSFMLTVFSLVALIVAYPSQAQAQQETGLVKSAGI